MSIMITILTALVALVYIFYLEHSNGFRLQAASSMSVETLKMLILRRSLKSVSIT